MKPFLVLAPLSRLEIVELRVGDDAGSFSLFNQVGLVW
ncbi:hypothetical protein FEAC_05630 [Ferrimicrobium acidiphilum DSM 19497]|uniref:Uncharacterized protein n=1 Tax=Ferrimicrobium acidiphilum DSM 19497 TaxID=1121877 RepID=A0A0D8FXY2_9ACTN|nr:hypothetical protein FEAC_05630 [Ferrimicrobium acidiphilum DSM 19497]